jgi:hypothetical protein
MTDSKTDRNRLSRSTGPLPMKRLSRRSGLRRPAGCVIRNTLRQRDLQICQQSGRSDFRELSSGESALRLVFFSERTTILASK